MEKITYEELMAHYGNAQAVALALGYTKPNSYLYTKKKAAARIGMWKYNGISRFAQQKLIVLMRSPARTVG